MFFENTIKNQLNQGLIEFRKYKQLLFPSY